MEITSTDHDNATVLVLQGNLDAGTAPDATETIANTIQQASAAGRSANVALDLSGVAFMSSAGLRTFLAATQEARSLGGDVRLAAASSNVHRVLDYSGFLNIMQYFPSIDEALSSFDG